MDVPETAITRRFPSSISSFAHPKLSMHCWTVKSVKGYSRDLLSVDNSDLAEGQKSRNIAQSHSLLLGWQNA